MSIIAEHMINNGTDVRNKVKKKLKKSTAKYKAAANKHRRFKSFKVGDKVMVHLRKERFHVGEYNKLEQQKIGSFSCLAKD
ncbi:hypothetical protein Patl1_35286 [Pistacia atlantica]|nr:hypothetical protein Patl1_35286 [Pistacia atlantica]